MTDSISQSISNLKREGFSITVEELRTCKGFENISEEEGRKCIDTLVRLSVLCYRTFAIENNQEQG